VPRNPQDPRSPVQVLDWRGLDLVPVDGFREQFDIDALLMGALFALLQVFEQSR
jgi:hypothetical protein